MSRATATAQEADALGAGALKRSRDRGAPLRSTRIRRAPFLTQSKQLGFPHRVFCFFLGSICLVIFPLQKKLSGALWLVYRENHQLHYRPEPIPT